MSENYIPANKTTLLTEREILVLILNALNNLSGGLVGGSQQMYVYTNNPNTEAIVPTNQNIGAIAYSNNKANPTYLWNTATKAWQ